MKYRAIWRWFPALLCGLLCCSAVPAGGLAAERVPTGDGRWYYRIGGGSPLFSLGLQVDPSRLGAGHGGWISGRCDFNPGASVSNYLNDFRRNIYGLNRALVDQAGAILRTSAMSVLQRANPGLYDLLSQGLTAGRIEFESSVRDCRQLHSANNSGSLLDGWQRIGRRVGWAQAEQRGDDAGAAARMVRQSGGDDGIQWVAGKMAGGRGQPPIALTTDLVRAGHQLLSGRQAASGDAPLAAHSSELVWSSPAAAAAWAVAVLGETELRLCADCEGLATRVGHGLQAELRSETERVLEQLEPLIAAAQRPSAAALSALAVAGMGLAINAKLIYALREESGANRAILGTRLAAEIALARALEKALTLRSLLRLGRQEPNVAANLQAQLSATRLLSRLEEEIDNILFEQRVRREALAGTALAILERSHRRNNEPLQALVPPTPPPRLDRFGTPAKAR